MPLALKFGKMARLPVELVAMQLLTHFLQQVVDSFFSSKIKGLWNFDCAAVKILEGAGNDVESLEDPIRLVERFQCNLQKRVWCRAGMQLVSESEATYVAHRSPSIVVGAVGTKIDSPGATWEIAVNNCHVAAEFGFRSPTLS